MYGIKLIQFANAQQFKSAPYVPVRCCGIASKDELTLAACGLYKFQEPYNYIKIGKGTL